VHQSLATTAVTAYASRNLEPGLALPFFIGALVCIFALNWTAKVPMLNLALFYGVSVFEGLMAGPVLSYVVRYVPNGAQLISLAFGLTAVTVGGIGTYVWSTGKEYGFLGRTLFIVLWVAIGLNVLMWFVPGPANGADPAPLLRGDRGPVHRLSVLRLLQHPPRV
jgi:FtsH-binding integral membrane protein